MDKIAARLEVDRILTGVGKAKWHTRTINKILRIEKCMGDALLQKTYTTDSLTKKRIKNNSTVPQYYVEADHKAIIIPKEPFLQMQEWLIRRWVVHKIPSGRKRTYSYNHCFAQIIVCGKCGELYQRVQWNKHGCKSIVWHCISRLAPTAADMNCTNRTVNETILEEVTVKALN